MVVMYHGMAVLRVTISSTVYHFFRLILLKVHLRRTNRTIDHTRVGLVKFGNSCNKIELTVMVIRLRQTTFSLPTVEDLGECFGLTALSNLNLL